MSRDPSFIQEEGCAWGDLVSFDPSLQGRIVVDQAMLAMWTSVLVFLAKQVQQEDASVKDLRLPENYVLDHEVSSEELISSITMCALLLRNTALNDEGEKVCDEEGEGLCWGEPCSLDVSLAQLTLIETALMYVLDHALKTFRGWVALEREEDASELDLAEDIEKLEEILTWCREDVLGVANMLCKEEDTTLH